MLVLWLLSGLLSTKYSQSAEWDQQCVSNCSCCIDRVCGETNGIPNFCLKGCIDGHRGERCYELCQYNNCKVCGGTTTSEVCTECYDGYYLGENKNCTSKCPSNCKSCTSSTNCYECNKGFYNQKGSTTCKYACPINCKCTPNTGHCVSCKTGYYNTLNSCQNRCPVNCLMCESDYTCQECKPGFYNGYYFDYHKGRELNNCTYKCRKYCVQCNSYDNCSMCIKGKYGKTCHDDCSPVCKDSICSIHNGQCICTDNSTEGKCMACIDGRFGPFCNQTCSKFCRANKCSSTSGACTGGCISETITGNNCSKCIAGMYGELCAMFCPKNCRKHICDRYSGSCIEGCLGDFNGEKCDFCIPGKFGENCTLDCSVNCADGICERMSGNCFQCVGNFEGKTCTECKSGYFGPGCHEACSEHCGNNTCNRTSGVCLNGCTSGYSGDRCCVISDHCVECYSNTECNTCERGYFRFSCNVRCPEGCLDSCDISTGKCIGCHNGFFGHICNDTCSSLCTGRICRQDDGICIYGCETHQAQPECIHSEGIQQQKDGTGNGITSAVLGSMLFLSLAVNVVLFAVFVIKKIKVWRSRAKSGPTYENQLECIGAQVPRTPTATDTRTSEADERNVYEGIIRENEQEHEYQHVIYVNGK